MHLYLIRHADPNYELDALTDQGVGEAQALAEKLSSHGIDFIYSSPAGRTRETARIISAAVGKPVIDDKRLLEPAHLKVEQNGKSYVVWDTFGETVRSPPEIPNQNTWDQFPPFNTVETGAMWQQFESYADDFIAEHGYTREGNMFRRVDPNHDRIALISHNGTVLMLLAYLLCLPLSLVWSGFFIWPSSVTTIYFEEHSERWAVPRALCVADTSHVYAAGLNPQPRGMGAGLYEPYI